MKIKGWLAISTAFHLVVGAAYAISVNLRSNEYQDLTYVQMSESHPNHNEPLPPELSDDGFKKKKPVIETNQKPEPAEDVATGNVDNTNAFVPYYMVEELPVALAPIQPVYPEEARRQGVEGRVMMQVYIDAGGNVKNVEVLKTPSEVLSQSAIKAVYGTKFRPARLNGQIKPVSMQLALKFRLE